MEMIYQLLSTKDVDWIGKMAFQRIQSLFYSTHSVSFLKRVIDVIEANTDNLGPLSLDPSSKNMLASWKSTKQEHVINNNASHAKITKIKGPEKLARRVKF